MVGQVLGGNLIFRENQLFHNKHFARVETNILPMTRHSLCYQWRFSFNQFKIDDK